PPAPAAHRRRAGAPRGDRRARRPGPPGPPPPRRSVHPARLARAAPRHGARRRDARRSGRPRMSRPLRVAVVGSGVMGRYHALNYATTPRVELVAMVGIAPGPREE